MYCSNCGNEMKDGQRYCSSCGFEKSVGTDYCENCGAKINKGQAMCISCGFMLDEKPTSTAIPTASDLFREKLNEESVQQSVEESKPNYDKYANQVKKINIFKLISLCAIFLICASVLFIPVLQTKSGSHFYSIVQLAISEIEGGYYFNYVGIFSIFTAIYTIMIIGFNIAPLVTVIKDISKGQDATLLMINRIKKTSNAEENVSVNKRYYREEMIWAVVAEMIFILIFSSLVFSGFVAFPIVFAVIYLVAYILRKIEENKVMVALTKEEIK